MASEPDGIRATHRPLPASLNQVSEADGSGSGLALACWRHRSREIDVTILNAEDPLAVAAVRAVRRGDVDGLRQLL